MPKRNKFLHHCSDWDYMLIDDTCPEIENCVCYSEIVNWYLVTLYRHLEQGNVKFNKHHGEYEWKML